MKLVPLDDRVVVSPFEPETQTPGGIVIPDTAKDKPTRGKVVAVGPGRLLDSGKLAPMAVAEGDTVLYAKYAGTMVEVEGREYSILKQDDLLAKLTA